VTRVRPFGEAALLVEFADAPDLGCNLRVHALARALDADPPPGLRALVPGYVSLLVEFSPVECDFQALAELLSERATAAELDATQAGPARERTIPTVYGGEFGPDLEEVADRLHLRPSQVIERHTAAEQRVYMLGFSPGFPYLGDLPPELALPRRATPRERVPLGSVAIAERQTGIYSREMPGGWHVLGRTPVPLFDPSRDPPAYLAPGDRVRFVPIDASDWDRLASCPDDW
jgi:KipI family sensor histidine kinase inhibitor